MTDLEMTKLCVEAMGLKASLKPDGVFIMWTRYDPLHDDAQAMALAKRLGLELMAQEPQDSDGRWWWDVGIGVSQIARTSGYDLNRAIVECVAKLQAAKK